MLKLYNSLTREVEEFKPIDPPNIGMYTCGPTVYDFMHIGNLRTFVLSDIVVRALTYNGYRVTTIENVTDIDDKIIKRAKEKNLTIDALTVQYTRYFLEDIAKLNIAIPSRMPRATEHVGKMIKYVEALLKKGLAYQEKDGSVYFDISKFPNYGRLIHIAKENLKRGTRVLSDEYSKEDVQDFALWKAVDPSEFGYPSPWGRGRPGWHIECSVMSQEYLGDTFDIHLGGIDLIFPHHENEIAQSEGKTGKKFVNFFVHGAHMLVDGEKMSKRFGNFYTLSDVVARGFDPMALRYLYLQTHYRQEMNFTWEALSSAQQALKNLIDTTSEWGEPNIGCAEFEERFLKAVNDDLNTPKALSVIWDLVKTQDYPSEARAQSLFKMDNVLGLNLRSKKLEVRSKKLEVPDDVMRLVREREELRKKKRYHLADQLRNKVKKMGYEIRDDNGESKVEKI